MVEEPVKSTFAVWLGRTDYARALELQSRACDLKKRGFAEDILLLLEHPPTVTLGRNGDWHHLLVSDETLRARGIARYATDRGGDITFHGPGQLVGYPILQLDRSERDVHRLMRNLEESLIRLLSAYGIEAGREDGLTGVWTDKGKIAALGIHISRWITHHGFALNVNTNLSYFDLIVPCGIAGKAVASMDAFLKRAPDLKEVAEAYATEFGEVFKRRIFWLSGLELDLKLTEYAHKSAVA
jgi:lipoate-protein ligase B